MSTSSSNPTITTEQKLLYLPYVSNIVANAEAEGNGNIQAAGGITSGAYNGVGAAGVKRNEHLDISGRGERTQVKGEAENEILHQLHIKEQRRFGLNILLIIASAVIFITVLSWFEVIRSLYDRTWEIQPVPDRFNPTYERMGYAVLVSLLAIIIVWIFYHIYQNLYPQYEIALN